MANGQIHPFLVHSNLLAVEKKNTNKSDDEDQGDDEDDSGENRSKRKSWKPSFLRKKKGGAGQKETAKPDADEDEDVATDYNSPR